MIRLQNIIDDMRSHIPQVNVDELKKAYVYSAKVHEGQVLSSGEPYLVHSLEVARISAKLNLDEASIIAALLYDVLKKGLSTPEEIEGLFGKTVRFLVEGLTKISQVSFHIQEQRQAENICKMLVAMSQDIRVVLVKLAERLHNMQTLKFVDPECQQNMSKETLEIFAPLANRLGIQWMKTELEDTSFYWLYPEQYHEIDEKLKRIRKQRKHYIEDMVKLLASIVEKNGIVACPSGRIKHHYSIYRKIREKNVNFDEIYDVIAFRILTQTVGDCYRVLGLIHALWKPVPGRFKDYIAMPKINHYQSLHTTVIGHKKERVEIQIRTKEMHQVAEQGVAAHWAYKERINKIKTDKDLAQFAWLRDILDQQKEVADPAKFLETAKVDLFNDEVFVFTPRGDVKAMAKGATALDFAYAVHTEVGHHCVGAKIDGKMVPLREKLRNGDTVTILTSGKQKPSKDWLKFTNTSRARNKIRAVIRAQERRRSSEIGEQVLEKECKRQGINLSRIWKNGELSKAAETLKFKSTNKMLMALGYGKLNPTQIIEQLLPAQIRMKTKK